MTVAELVALLQTLPPDLPVVQDNDDRVFVVTGAEPDMVSEPYPRECPGSYAYRYGAGAGNSVSVVMLKTD